jgi:hypothetical protein
MRVAANTHSENVILIAFPRKLWLHECASKLRWTYIACLVFYSCAEVPVLWQSTAEIPVLWQSTAEVPVLWQSTA